MKLKSTRNCRTSPLDIQIETHQKAGNDFRKKTKYGWAMAGLAITAIRKIREEVNHNPNKPIPRCAYIIRSLKHPNEAIVLKETYGVGFYLIGGYSPRNARVDKLAHNIASTRHSVQESKFRGKAEDLITIDEAETGNDAGQNVRDVYPHSDVFFDLGNQERLKQTVARFTEIVFGYPFHTPTREEYIMFHATASALRSSDLSRQVGAVIATDDGDITAVGVNEVPKAGGGMYWPEDQADSRDFVFQRDHGAEMKKNTLGEVIGILQKKGWLNDKKANMSYTDLLQLAIPDMKNSRLMSIGEYGRTVHAEMSALLDAAKQGVSVQGKNLFTTTFPCHNCAKHIVYAGIKRVVYIEPYPKSLANILHMDSIADDNVADCAINSKIKFEPFVGIAPKRYISLFTMVKRKQVNGNRIKWNANTSMPRYLSMTAHLTYLDREKEIAHKLSSSMKDAGLTSVRT